LKENNISIDNKILNLFGITLSCYTLEETLDRIDEAISKREKLHIGVVNAAKTVNMRRNPKLRQDVLSSDMILADGMAVVWATKLLSPNPLPERVTGIDIMYGTFERGNKKGYRIFLFGATEKVSQIVAERLQNQYPGVVLAGRRNGYFNDDEEEEIAQQIAASKADILFVAITSPKKENFMARWTTTMNVPVVHGVGGSFDVMAGKVERAPMLWQKLGLEWLYRVKQEPGRLWKRYMVTNSIFCAMVLRQYLSFKKKK
jgi:N-acetylglucosaminyldiphosphoundecaprenol N-acetyl-beta-D-mannosaminyltransferase